MEGILGGYLLWILFLGNRRVILGEMTICSSLLSKSPIPDHPPAEHCVGLRPTQDIRGLELMEATSDFAWSGSDHSGEFL